MQKIKRIIVKPILHFIFSFMNTAYTLTAAIAKKIHSECPQKYQYNNETRRTVVVR